MVECRQLRLAQALDGRQDAGVYDTHFKVGVGALQVLAALQVSDRRVIDAVGAIAHVPEEREPDIAGEALLAPVVKLAQDQHGDDKILIRLRDQLRAGLVNAISRVERRQERPGIKDKRHLGRWTGDRLVGNVGRTQAVGRASEPKAGATARKSFPLVLPMGNDEVEHRLDLGVGQLVKQTMGFLTRGHASKGSVTVPPCLVLGFLGLRLRAMLGDQIATE
jgi:hypothetical protein